MMCRSEIIDGRGTIEALATMGVAINLLIGTFPLTHHDAVSLYI